MSRSLITDQPGGRKRRWAQRRQPLSCLARVVLLTRSLNCKVRLHTGWAQAVTESDGTGSLRRVEPVSGGGPAERHPMILFDNEWTLQRTAAEWTRLRFHDVQPGLESAQSTSPQEAHAGASGTT